ncbi:hypothetical protein EMPG_17333 [Blastomyces silverae]|uniref:CFEM domain-containing protein n=1 Tax=Blastomyces silverae TaxID=2060906 RepID=A0A0H1B6Z9_9EURO|nr:hypothetical protein EMPG_17333 [Blastomyces silverae]
MSVRQAFVATVLIAVYVGTGASAPECASTCFQTAVNDHACDQWLSDADCCRNGDFLISIANCVTRRCSRQLIEEAWDHLAEQCDKVDIDLPSIEFEPVPSSTSTTSIKTIIKPSTTSSASGSSTFTASVPTTLSTTGTLPTEPPTTGTPTTGRGVNTTPGGSYASNDDDHGSGGANLSAKAAIIVSTVITVLALALFLFLRQRRQKATPPSTEAQNNAAHENKPLVCEISGTEISGSSRYQYAAELEAVEISRAGGTTPPPLNSNTTSHMEDSLKIFN